MVVQTVDKTEFRKVLGQFATGVTVVTMEAEDGIHGMTANSFTSVSLEPPLVLVCIAKGSRMAKHIQSSHSFCITILAAQQESLSRYFAGGRGLDVKPDFEFVPFSGTHRVAGGLGALACERADVFSAGDHDIVLGRVISLYRAEEAIEPLLFFAGAYAERRRDE